MKYDPHATQELENRAASSDRHRLNDMLWAALKNHDDGIADLLERITKLETTLKNLTWLIGVLLALLGIFEARH